MKALGTFCHRTNSGNLLLRGNKIPSLYSWVVTKDLKKVGKVQDVIGPVSKPYIVIKPTKTKLTIKESILYELPKNKRSAIRWKKK